LRRTRGIGEGWHRRVASSLRGLRGSRVLCAPEREFVRREFGESVAVDRLRLAGGGHPTGRCAWQPIGALIQMDDACFEWSDPRNALRLSAYPTLAHEVLHVWQRRHRHCVVNVSVDGLWLGLTRGAAAYAYDRTLDDAQDMLAQFLAANIEGQGQMYEDYVRSNVSDSNSRDARYALIAAYVKAPARHFSKA
jgi:hypothetical protein